MAKFNTVANTNNKTPTMNSSLKDALSESLGSLPPIVEEQIDQTAPVETSSEASGQDFPSNLGYSPEGAVLPIEQRQDMAELGELNPTLNSGEMSSAPVQSMIPDAAPFQKEFPTYKSAPDNDAMTNMLGRSDTFANSMVNRGLSGNLHFNKDEQALLTPTLRADADPTNPSFDATRREAFDRKAERDNTIGETLVSTMTGATVKTPEGFYNINPEFAKLISLVTEDHIPTSFMGAPEEMYEEDFNPETPSGIKQKEINPVESAGKLGRNIHQWWDNSQQFNQGERPAPMSEQQAKDLGAWAIQAYQLSNPDMVETAIDPETGGVRYKMTPKGEAEFARSEPTRKDIFNIKFPPLHARPQDGQFPESLSGLRPQFRKKKSMGELGNVEEAIRNQSRVNHVVDKRRSRIAAAMIIPTMFRRAGQPDDIWGDLFGVGQQQLARVFIKETKLNGKSPQDAEMTAVNIINAKKKDLAKELMAIVQNSDMPNYLTYAVQTLTARQHAQQTDFNPTRNKVVRFVARGQTPTRITKGSESYNNMWQILALNLLNDKQTSKGLNDLLMPAEREAESRRMAAEWYKMGEAVEAILEEAVPEAIFNKMVTAFKGGMGLNDPNFPKSNLRSLGERLPPNVLQLVKDKGEDGPMALESLIELKHFVDNIREKGEHYSNLNAFIDGKTNGIANAAMVLGNRKLAFNTGVLRPDEATWAVQDEQGNPFDVRDAMAFDITNRVDEMVKPVTVQDGSVAGSDEINTLREVLGEMGKYKPLNKAISMIFPYGKELEGMIKEVTDHFTDKMGDDPLFKANVDFLESRGVSMENQMEQVHANVVQSLFTIFGDDTFTGRSVMRNSSFLMAAMDKNLAITGPVGATINLGGDKFDMSKSKTSKVMANNKETGDTSTLMTQVTPSYQSSAAGKGSSIGGHGRARSVVIPVHAIDAGISIRTFSGKSWEKIVAKYDNESDAYLSQIYDAYKVDPTNFKVVETEVNKNFEDIALNEFDYFQRAYEATVKAQSEFQTEMVAKAGEMWPVGPEDRFNFIGSMLNPTSSIDGKGETKITHEGVNSYIRGAFPMKVGEDKNEYNARVNNNAKELLASIRSATGLNLGTANQTAGEVVEAISSGQALVIVKMMSQYVKYTSATPKFLSKIKEQRKSLAREVNSQRERTGHGVYQFYAH